jgi:hypothetical protein
MTYVQTETVTCSKCSKEQTVSIHSTLNVTLDPALRENLFNGQINTFDCSSCGHQAMIGVPLLYHDMDRKFAVQFYPEESLDEEDFIKQFDHDLTRNDDLELTSTEKMPRYLLFPHIVFDMQELMRYVVFRERLFEKKELERH